MNLAKRIFDKFEEVIGVSILFYMLVILSYQVLLRFLFNNANSWSEESARYLYVWFTYITASLAILKGTHIRIDALLGLYPKKMVKHVVLFGYLVFLIYCFTVIYYSSIYTRQIYQAKQVSMGLGTPMYLVWLSLPVCHSLMSIRIVQRMYHIFFLNEPVRLEVQEDR